MTDVVNALMDTSDLGKVTTWINMLLDFLTPPKAGAGPGPPTLRNVSKNISMEWGMARVFLEQRLAMHW